MAINTLYIDRGALKSASAIYNSQLPKNIRLEKFFQPSVFSLLQKKLFKSKYSSKFHPYKYRYSTTRLREVGSFLNGRYFDGIVRNMMNLANYKCAYEIKKFEPGDYTLLHDSEKEKKGIDFVLDFSESSESYGGYTAYLTESEEILQLSPSPNTLSFVERNKGVMRYVKYVQHKQKSPLVFVMGTLCMGR